MTARRAALYLRQSVTRKDGNSVSLATQQDLCTKWAESQGYQVVGVWSDPDTSGSKFPPSARPGWRRMAGSDFDVVVVYKIDRLSRNFLTFWDTVKALTAEGRTLASVSENIDLGTPTGKIVASVLAGVAEMTAADISQRVADTRRALIRGGRLAGGKVPYGWCSVPNAEGMGFVLAQDPNAIETVREMVTRVQGGDTVYAVMQWLHGQGVEVSYSTVERMLRHPILAGMIPFNPGNDTRTRGADVLRDADGLPVVHDDLAVMPVADWRAMVARLDDRDSAKSRPRSACAATSSLLSGLVWCADGGKHDEPVRMHRGTTQGRPGYQCPKCYQTVTGFEDAVVGEFLRARGDLIRLRAVEVVHEGGTALLPEIEHRLDELAQLIRDADRERRPELQAEQANLLDLRDEKRAETPIVEYRWEGTDATFGEDWAVADTLERRAVLEGALERVLVTRGGRGRRTHEQLLARLTFEWQPMGQVTAPSDAELAAWATA